MFYRVMEDGAAMPVATTPHNGGGKMKGEAGNASWTASRAAIDALAASMLVTIFLDLW
jgi:hypothetical protein